MGKELRLVWLCDCSGSMAGAKISALNQAIKDCVASLRGRVETLDVQILVGAIQFGNNGDATWLIDKTPLDNRFDWPDLEAKIGNLTPTGKALRLLAKSFDDEQFSDDAYPPVLILISDGEPTDNFDAGFAELMKKKWGQDSFRCAIGVGDDVDVDALSIFTGNNADCLLRCDESCDKLAQLVLNRFVFFIDKPVWNVI